MFASCQIFLIRRLHSLSIALQMKFPVSACLIATLALASCTYSEEKPQSEIQGSSDNPSQNVNEETIQASNNKELLSELRAGGYVIYMRHATTEKDYADQADPSMRLSDCCLLYTSPSPRD